MRKVKLSEFDSRVLINGLYHMRYTFPDEKRIAVNDVLLKAIAFSKGLKLGHNGKLKISPAENKIVIGCLMD